MQTQLRDNSASRQIVFRIWRKLRLGLVRTLYPILPQRIYMQRLTAGLRAYGMRISGAPIYISPKCWFDGTDYSLIEIEDKVVISTNVSILTHDFSLARARDALAGQTRWPEIALVRGIRIGANSFVGRGAILMPGTNLGRNCIVGAGSVVRGEVPDDSIIVGNPAQVVGSSLEWGARKLQELGVEP